jgi:plastocyanin
MKMARTKLLVIVAAATCTLVVGGSATATEDSNDAGPYLVSGAGGQFYGYATPVMTVQAGGELSYANFDIVQHDVVHDVEVDGVANKKKDKWCKAYKKKGTCPLFWSPQASLGETVTVLGLKNLEPGGAYSFFCTLHPGMKGKLVVAP